MATTSDCGESVIINVSSSHDPVRNRKVNGALQEPVSKALTLVTNEEIPVHADVTVQSKDLLFLGEVLRCVAIPGAKWTTHVRVKRSLLVI